MAPPATTSPCQASTERHLRSSSDNTALSATSNKDHNSVHLQARTKEVPEKVESTSQDLFTKEMIPNKVQAAVKPQLSAKGLCTHCGSSATLVCSGCADSPAIDSASLKNTLYCNSTCQKNDRDDHRELCRRLQARKDLYRLGAILREIFYQFRESLFDKVIRKVEERDGKLFIYEGHYPKKNGVDALVWPFPHHLVSEKNDKYALLTYLACTDAIGFLHEPIKYMLSDVASHVEEQYLTIKNVKRQTIRVFANGVADTKEFPHEAFEITLRHGGEHFALDLASAQFGFDVTVEPWDDYAENRIKFVTRVLHEDPVSFGRRFRFLQATMAEVDVYRRFLLEVNLGAAHVVLLAIKEWEKVNAMPVRNLLRLEKKSFEKRMMDLVNFVQVDLVKHLLELDRRASRRGESWNLKIY